MGVRMPFDGASWKRWEEDPEWLRFERRWRRRFRVLWVIAGVIWFGVFVAMLWI
jgi:hypothetical protein